MDINDILDNIEDAVTREADCNKSYNENVRIVYDCSLTDDDKSNLQDENRSTLTFPIVAPLIAHQLKNINESVPSATVYPVDSDVEPDDEDTALAITAKLNSVYETNRYSDVVTRCADNAATGGKGAIKISTEYVNNINFQQKVVIKNCEDPTQVYFDPSAKEPTKCDGEYVFERVPLEKSTLRRMYPDVDIDKIEKQQKGGDNFCWISTTETGKKIFYVVDYFYKKHEKETIYLVEDEFGEEVTKEKPENKDSIKAEREVDNVSIYHTRICADEVLEKESQLNFTELPYVFVASNKKTICGKEMYIPFAKPAIDAQRVKNIALNYLFFELTNASVGRWVVAEESMTDLTQDAIENPSQIKTMVYKAFGDSEGMPRQNPVPVYHTPPPISEQNLMVFNSMDEQINTIMGSQFSSLDQTNMSGTALYNLADFMNAATASLMTNLISATAQAAKVIISAFPFLHSSESIDVSTTSKERLVDVDFEEFELERFAIDVKKGVNYALQQQLTVEQLIKLSETTPSMAAWLNDQGMPLLLENMNLNNKTKIISSYESFKAEADRAAQSQQKQPNPDMLKAQAQMMNAQNNNAKVHLEESRLAMDAQKNATDSALDMHKINSDKYKTNVTANIDAYDIRSENQRELLRHTQRGTNV